MIMNKKILNKFFYSCHLVYSIYHFGLSRWGLIFLDFFQDRDDFCLDGKQCIKASDKCNSYVECRDNSDEKLCIVRSEEADFFKTNYTEGRKLIYLVSDTDFTYKMYPANVECPDGYFECPYSKHCLPVYLRCNGKLLFLWQWYSKSTP